MMSRETVNTILRFIERFKILTVEITGVAQQLNPSFNYLPVRGQQERALKIWGPSANAVERQSIQVGNHCYSLSPGARSSCGGSYIS